MKLMITLVLMTMNEVFADLKKGATVVVIPAGQGVSIMRAFSNCNSTCGGQCCVFTDGQLINVTRCMLLNQTKGAFSGVYVDDQYT